MNELFAFIDESGDLGPKGSKYFVITAVWTNNPAFFERLIKNLRRHKFRKQLKNVQELKANKSSPELRQHLLKRFGEIEEARAHSIVLDKTKVTNEELIDKNKIYNYACGHLAASLSAGSKNLVVRIDKSKGKQALRDDFDAYFREKLKENFYNKKVEIYHSWSNSWPGLQIADFVAWATFQKFEHSNDSYMKLIEKKVNLTFI